MGGEINDQLYQTGHSSSAALINHALGILKLILVILLFTYLISIYLNKGKVTRRRNPQYSYINSWFGTGDITKDMITLKNTIMNKKIQHIDHTSLDQVSVDRRKANSDSKVLKRVSFNETPQVFILQ